MADVRSFQATVNKDDLWRNSRVVVGGVDLTTAIRSFTFHFDTESLPTLTVEFVMHEGVIDGDAVIHLPDSTQDALLSLGWTPPGE